MKIMKGNFTGLILTGMALAVLFASCGKYGSLSGNMDDLWNEVKEAQFCTVSFETYGGTEVPSQKLEKGSLVEEPEAGSFSKTRNLFRGWFKEASFETLWNFINDTAKEDLTLYAKWEEIPLGSFGVKFVAAGSPTVFEDIAVLENDPVPRPDNPERISYTFAGWCTDLELTNLWDFTSDVVTKGMVNAEDFLYLYAKWNSLPSGSRGVRFVTNGGIPVPEDQVIPSGEKVTAPVIGKAGYTFGGWYREPACTTPWLFDTDTVSSGTTALVLYAKWNEKDGGVDCFTVNFSANGGSPAWSQIVVKEGSLATEPAVPARSNYVFLGWYTDADGSTGNEWFFTTGVTQNLVFYAKWGSPTVSISGNTALNGQHYQTAVLTASQDLSETIGGVSVTVGAYQWRRGSTNISGATSSSYTVASADRGANLSVVLTFMCDAKNLGTITSSAKTIHPGTPVNGPSPTALDIIRNDMAGDYILLSDITISNDFTPIVGTNTAAPSYGGFTGTFDGNGKTIALGSENVVAKQHTIGSNADIFTGLFAFIAGGTVKNLKLTGTIINTVSSLASNQSFYAGAVAGLNNGTIRNVSSAVNVTVSATNNFSTTGWVAAGGITGYGGGIENCYSTGTISATFNRSPSGTGSNGAAAGGISGYYTHNGVKNCWASGNITAASSASWCRKYSGGIAGYTSSNISSYHITNSVALNGNLTGDDENYIGRIWGSGGGGSNNFGRDNMQHNNSTGSWSSSITGKNGADVSTAAGTGANTQIWWTGTAGWTVPTVKSSASETNPWVWNVSASGLPANRPVLWFEVD